MDKRNLDRRVRQYKYNHSNNRQFNRREKDNLDKNIYRAIMILVPLILIIWAINLR